MPNYKQLYFKLFAAMADAVEQIEAANYGLAHETLITAQQEAEDAYLGPEDQPCP